MNNFSSPNLEVNTIPETDAGKSNNRSFYSAFTAEDKKIHLAFRVYRFISLFLTASYFVVLSSHFPTATRFGLTLLLLITALLVVYLYKIYRKNYKLITFLVVLELTGLSFLLAYTGGLESPFLWYALNPLLIAAVHLPYYLLWILLAVFFPVTVWQESSLISSTPPGITTVINSIPPALTVIIILFLMQVFSRLYLLLSEQSSRLELQQKELVAAYQNLSQDHYVFQRLSHFQKEVVACQNEKDMFKSLAISVLDLFPFTHTVVMVYQDSLTPLSTDGHLPDLIIQPEEKEIQTPVSHYRATLKELLERRQELLNNGTNPVMVGDNRNWIAVPLHSHSKAVNAVFVGWLKPKVNPFSFTENLLLFVKFTEQAAQRLYILKQNESTLQHLSSLYAAVESVSSLNSPQEVTDLFAAYGRAMTGCEKVILWMDIPEINGVKQHPVYSVKGKKDAFPEDSWQKPLLQAWNLMCSNLQPVVQPLSAGSKDGGQLVCVPVKSGSHSFGLLAAISPNSHASTENLVHTLSILGDLCAIALERNLSEVFADKLLLLEEQNRIAGEIHDNISQNIFSAVYGLDALSKETAEILKPEYRERLVNIRNLVSETARELRVLIYRLSPRNRGDNTFLKEIAGYLEGLARLNQVSIKPFFSGKEEYLNPAIRKAFYRILKEATGNSIRHGGCREITVELEMNPFRCVLNISDDGTGFQVREFCDLYQSGNHLGLVNMRELALSLQGNLEIKSEPGRGTAVTCSVPTSPLSQGKVSL